LPAILVNIIFFSKRFSANNRRHREQSNLISGREKINQLSLKAIKK
jgi:hypothetical protein